MRTLFGFGLLCLSSCTLIFSRLSQPCEQGPPRCEGDTFVTCEEGFELSQECAPGTCDLAGCAACGDGILQATEECDDANTADADGCDSNCTATACGNGVTTPPEQCDDQNLQSGDGCDQNCKIEGGASCGDGILDANEACDNGDQNSDTTPDACRTNCQPPSCGDTVIDSNEQCDDGNAQNADGCNSCVLPVCGDAFLDPNEGCDDGNITSGDGCDASCNKELIPELEPNDNIKDADGNAATVPGLFINSSRIITGTASANDTDFFLLDAALNDVLRIEVFDSSGVDCVGLDSFFSILDAGGAPIISDDDSGILNCSALVAASDGGAFFLELDNNSPTPIGYRVEISYLSGAGVEQEPNDNAASANPFVGNEIFLLGNHPLSAEEDFYEITLPQTASLRLELIEGDFNKVCDNFEIDSILTLFDAQGIELEFDDDSGRGDCSLIDGTGSSPQNTGAHDLPAGVYFLRVSSAVAGATGSFAYRLALTAR